MDDSNSSNVHDISGPRRHKIKKRNIQKFIGFMTILVLALGLYVSRDRWVPKTNESDDPIAGKEISNGNFPLSVTNGVDYQSCPVGKGFALLSDTRLYMYSTDGELLDTRANSYPNMILKPGNNRALLYEQSGYNFKIESRGKTIYEKSLDNQIILAAISQKGFVAVITSSDRYVCELKVYDADGDEIYSRGCVERIMDVSFNSDSSGCYILSVNASEGKIFSTVTAIDFKSTDDLWRSSPLDTCCISSFAAGDNGLFLLGDTSCAFYNSEGLRTYEFTYKSSLIDTSFCDGKSAMLFESKESRKTTLVLFGEPDLDPTEVSLYNTVQSIYADENAVYVLGENSLDAYSYKGKHLKSVELKDVFSDFYKLDKYIMLLGYNKIDRIEFSVK